MRNPERLLFDRGPDLESLPPAIREKARTSGCDPRRCGAARAARWAVILAGGLMSTTMLRAEHVPLGVVFRDEARTDAFRVANDSEEPLLLARAESSCDCFSTDGLPVAIAPGETQALPFRYRSHTTGSFTIEVKLLGPDGTTVVDRHSVSGFVADREWLLAPESARALFQKGGAVLVDVRAESRFAAAHIARSINLPAFALKARPAWRAQSLVLVDEGFAPDALLAPVAELRAQGFTDVRVLDGGLPAWIRGGGVVEGTSTSSLVAARLTAAEFAHAAATAEWRVFEIGGAQAAGPSLPGIVSAETPEKLVQAIISEETGVNGRPGSPVLVIAANDSITSRIEALTAAQTSAQIYYLEGGRAALEAFLHQQRALATNERSLMFVRSRQPTRPAGGCAPCGR